MARKSSFLLAGVALAALNLAACGEPTAPPKKAVAATDAIYATYQDCLVDHEEKVCKEALDKAKVEQAKNAPKFGTKAECEAQFGPGHCETNSSGSFVPAMMGFMLGSMLANNGGGGPGYYDSNSRYGPRTSPVYYGTNGAVYSNGQRATAPVRSTPAPVPATTVARGGLSGSSSSTVTTAPARSTSTYSSPSTYSSRSTSSYSSSRSSGSVSRGGFSGGGRSSSS